MKPILNLIKFSFLTLFLCGVLTSAMAAAPYPVYMTQQGKVTLGLKTPLNTGEEAIWTADGASVTPNADGSYTIDATGKAVGVHTYKVFLKSPSLCNGDVLEYEVYILPTPTVELTASSNLYCTNAETPLSELTATATAAPLPAGVEYKFIWEGTLAGTTKNPADEWGELAASTATSSTFKFTTTEVGTFDLKVKVEYSLPAGSTSVLRSDAATYGSMVSAPQSIVVAPKPATPEIIVVAE